eukprot:3934510-Rhodomonas_salina.4
MANDSTDGSRVLTIEVTVSRNTWVRTRSVRPRQAARAIRNETEKNTRLGKTTQHMSSERQDTPRDGGLRAAGACPHTQQASPHTRRSQPPRPPA